jgi:predicted O-methyltransferase YrrM
MNFGQYLATIFPTRPESEHHPHAPEEKAELFQAFNGSSAEVETITFINALVCLHKPKLVLETGSGSGFGTIAIACALKTNGFGHLHSVEIDANTSRSAGENMDLVDSTLRNFVSLHNADSQAFIKEWTGEVFDFVFFDSLIAFRHTEFNLLLAQGLLAPNALCVFHDTSRLRFRYFNDYNPEMIAALDAQSAGRQWMEFAYTRGMRVIKLG